MEGVALTPESARLLNSKKGVDHHAIIPTMELANTDLSGLRNGTTILTLARARLFNGCRQTAYLLKRSRRFLMNAGQTFTAKSKDGTK